MRRQTTGFLNTDSVRLPGRCTHAHTLTVLVVLVLEQLTVPAGQQVARLTEQLQGLLFVDVAERWPLIGHATGFWDTNARKTTQNTTAHNSPCQAISLLFAVAVARQKAVPSATSSFCRMVWSLVNLTLWCASTQVKHRNSTQSTQNPEASVLSSQLMQICGQRAQVTQDRDPRAKQIHLINGNTIKSIYSFSIKTQ